jgi:D-3-phosphoglycerate dehydrogenase / 2-oxoglutarate reductase
MTELRVLITDGLKDQGQALLRAAAQVDDRSGISPEELLEIIGQYDALIVRSRTKVTAGVIAAASQLKAIGRAGVGVDNIDLEAAQARDIAVLNTPTSTSIAVAEHTLALMLSLARSIPKADAATKAGQWIKKSLSGVELYRKTLGILGMGNIGKEVARAVSRLWHVCHRL